MANDRKEYMKNYRKTNFVRLSAYQKMFNTSVLVRNEIIALLGGKCSKCGFSDVRALQIDHINGGGHKEMISFRTIYKYYVFVLEQLKAGSKDYQLLCANCNWIKRAENNEA